MRLPLLLLACFSFATSLAQNAQEILNKSIAYHDPNGEWKSLKAIFYFTETRPNGPDRKTVFTIDNSRNQHTLNRNDEEIYEASGSNVKVLKGKGDIERGKTLRNYYLYIWGLPMKLMDAGTNLSSKVTSQTSEGVVCYVLNVEYEKETWSYFIDAKTYQMRAYGFKKKDGSNQEEYISLEGEIKVGGMSLPKARSWYDMPKRKFLGTDTLDKVE